MAIISFFIINFFASVYQGLAGFGFVLIAAPLSLLFLDKYTTVVSLDLIAFILNLFLVFQIKHKIHWKLVIILLLASIIGMPIGLWLLAHASIQLIKIAAGTLAIIFTLLIVFKKSSATTSPNTFVDALAGIASGILQTSTGMSGPPIVLTLAKSGKEKNEMRKTLVTFFLFLNLISLPFFFINGQFTWQHISIGIYALPFCFLGAQIGHKLAHKFSQRTYKILALITVTITGLISIYSGVTSF